ncbi:MAG: NAD-dependent epimerase/dehydratase family protein [Abditibacteriaceae bacterium]
MRKPDFTDTPIMMSPLSKIDLDHVFYGVGDDWRQLQNANIFITGGTGFFGCWLLESLIYANQHFQLNLNATILTRNPERISQQLPHLVNAAELNFIKGDVRDKSTFVRLSELTRGEVEARKSTFTHIIHAATPTSALINQTAPLEMFDVIVEGTRTVLNFATQCGKPKVLFTSSGAIYGKQPTNLSHIPEEFSGGPDSLDINSSYAEGKRAAEWLCAAYINSHQLPIKIARCFTFVGPHLPLNEHFAIGNFLRDARAGKAIHIAGNGTPMRSYLHAADLTIWLWKVLLNGDVGHAYNVGSEDAFSIHEIAQNVANCISPKPEIIVAQKPPSDNLPPRYIPSTQRAQNELELTQQIDLTEAISRTLSWLNNSPI